VWPQVLAMVLLLAAAGWKLVLLATGRADDVPAAAANVFWAGYDVLQLSVVLRAVAYRPALAPEALEDDADAHPPAVPRPVGAEAH
jgi:hypothetical protein